LGITPFYKAILSHKNLSVKKNGRLL